MVPGTEAAVPLNYCGERFLTRRILIKALIQSRLCRCKIIHGTFMYKNRHTDRVIQAELQEKENLR
jgi:hypothetical protein